MRRTPKKPTAELTDALPVAPPRRAGGRGGEPRSGSGLGRQFGLRGGRARLGRSPLAGRGGGRGTGRRFPRSRRRPGAVPPPDGRHPAAEPRAGSGPGQAPGEQTPPLPPVRPGQLADPHPGGRNLREGPGRPDPAGPDHRRGQHPQPQARGHPQTDAPQRPHPALGPAQGRGRLPQLPPGQQGQPETQASPGDLAQDCARRSP